MITLTILSHAEGKKSILILDSQSQEPYKTLRESMISELAKLGYSEGKNLLINYDVLGNFEGKGLNILSHAKEEYDVIFLNGTIAVQGALEFINKEKPDLNKYNFIFGNVTDPVGLGLITEFGAPSNTRFTGIAYPVNVEEKLRFIKKNFGKNLKIGYIYAEMPQSITYNKWLEEALKKDEFKDMKFIFRNVEFVKSDGGQKRMARLAEPIVKELDNQVDIFLSPNDQMGISMEFGQMVYSTATKPLVGVGKDKGSVASLTSDVEKNGKKIALMIKQIFEGKKINEIIPQSSESTIYYDEAIGKKFKISNPK